MWRYLCALIFSINFVYIISTETCPNKCTCKRSADWLKVRCGDIDKLTLVDDNEFLNIANEVVQLNLSNNSLSVFAPKVQFVALQKLDLSRNQLVHLTNNQFTELPNLRRLDLSANGIKIIDQYAFKNLNSLDSLKLSQNQISTIEKGTFAPFTNLKDLDISGNPLKCDCSLLWLLDWAKKQTVKLKSNPKCDTPQAYQGRPLRKIKVGEEIHCKSPATKNRDIPIVELTPDHSQVVFEGDSLKLQCRAPSIHEEFADEDEERRDRVEWLWLDANPRHHFDDITIADRFLADDGLIDSSLTIGKLHRNHSGMWNCQLVTHQGNHSKGITVVVISDETRYCPIATSSNNKGSYTWPRTVVNYTVTLPCESGDGAARASYHCSAKGEWSGLNTSTCDYNSETTKILEQFAKVNLTLAKGSILESAKHLRNTSDIKVMRDVMDFVFATRTVYNYLEHLQVDPELGPLLLEIINGFMDLSDGYIREADREDNACWKLLRAVETITNYTHAQQLHKSHIIVEQFHVRQETFTGMTCTWYLNGDGVSRHEKIFHCVTTNITSTVAAHNQEIEASIEVPSNIFYQLQEADVMMSAGNLLVAMFDQPKFFPLHQFNQGKGKEHKIISPVVGVKLGNLMINLTHPVYIMLKPFESDVNVYQMSPTPVWWNPTLNLGKGGWTHEGCQLRHELEDNLVFSCDHLGYYGLLQDTAHAQIVFPGAQFRFSHPAIYVGSLILFVCLLLCIVSYLFSYSAIQMPKKAKHSVVNLWLSIVLLCFIYVFGIYQTEDVQLCQIIGLVLHYLSLSSMLWLCVSVNSMYKRLRKNTDVIELQDDELPSDEPVQKPILGLYLVGWGIALIVCGISGAVNMKEYAAQTHCFLSTGPALSALYIPFGLLFLVLVVLFMLIRCAIYGTDANGHLSEGTQATENVDLDLLEPNFPDCRSMRSVSTKTASSEVEDPEHAPMAQLKAHVIFLILYILAWLSCAFATINKFKIVPYEEDVFSIVYAILASLLGLFALFFYCVARNDVRTEWVLTGRFLRGRGKCFRSRNISDLPTVPQIQIQPLPPIPEPHAHAHMSRCSSRSSSQHTKSLQGAIAMKAADLNASTLTDNSATKINNVNLVVLHRQQYRNNGPVPNLIENPTHTAEMFYNPHQSTVARRFFKKQKRHLMKRNNLTARRPPTGLPSKDNSSVDTNIFANNAKVNNTNIHVEHVPKRHRNLNILSDSCEDLNSVVIPVDKLLESRKNKGHKPRAKKKQNVAAAICNNQMQMAESNNMRSVSQQCTLEYSSEPISDSILDQKSPERPSFTTETTASDMLASLRRENSPNMSTLTEEPQFYSSVPKDEFLNARIYVNPTHEFKNLRAQSRASSVSATEIEELYQQIKRGPGGFIKAKKYRKGGRESPFLSDSEVRSYSKSEKDETTV